MSLRTHTRHRQRGAVLILVLWVVGILTFLAAAFSRQILIENKVVSEANNRIRLRASVTATLNYLAVSNQINPEALKEIAGQPRYLEVPGAAVQFVVKPEEAYVSLNAAGPELLGALISAYPGETKAVESLVDALIDWRDADNIPLTNGAEDDAYAFAGYTYTPKNGPFSSVDELSFVIGFSRELVDWLKPYLSIASESPAIDPRFADPQLLQMLGAAELVKNIDFERLAEDSEYADSLRVEDETLASTEGGAYRLRVAVNDDSSGAVQAIEAVVNFGKATAPAAAPDLVANGPQAEPYRIIEWNEFPATPEQPTIQ